MTRGLPNETDPSSLFCQITGYQAFFTLDITVERYSRYLSQSEIGERATPVIIAALATAGATVYSRRLSNALGRM